METNPTLEGMRQILTLSYNHLPHHLKACMMYLSIFPDDYIICKDRLLKRWIAEGLVAEKRGMTLMELAEGYLNELVSRSMIDWADGKEETCRVHDMMLEILVSKSLETNFVSLVGGQYQGISYTNTIRRLSVHGGLEAHDKGSWSSKSGGIKGMMVQHVRSLSIFDPEVNKKLLGRLDDFALLRVLDLEDCKGLRGKHLVCICRMYLLRFLSLKGTDVEVIPPRIGDLEHLQTLDVRETNLKGLPRAVKKLEKLEHLLFSGKSTGWYSLSGWTLTQGIKEMKALRQVNRAVIYDPKAAEEIGELEQLEEIAIYVDTREEILKGKKMEIMDVVTVSENLACSLNKMCSLRWLEVGNFGCGKWPFVRIMAFLDNVESPPRLLRYLKIWGHMYALPGWVGTLTDLVECDIAWTYLDGVQLFRVLCKLPNLKRLVLGAYFIVKGQNMIFWGRQEVKEEEKKMANINYSYEEGGEGDEEAGGGRGRRPFPKLKELTLGYSPEVPPVYIFRKGSMPELDTLALQFGDQGKGIAGMKHLTNLKEVQFDGNRSYFEGALAQLEELNKMRNDKSTKISVRARYKEEE
jgi:disease resistance protein RPM1